MGLCERHGGGPSQLRCWRHSHGDFDPLDAFPGEGLVSLGGHRRGDLLCRVDRWGPGRETRRELRLEAVGDPPASAEALRAAIRADVAALVRRPGVPPAGHPRGE